MNGTLGRDPLQYLGDWIEEETGLIFPSSRIDDLKRATRAEAVDSAMLAAALENHDPTLIRRLIPHITIGETYFFRNAKLFDALAGDILPRLIEDAVRGTGGRRTIRIWSAGCCTGEEPYSIAILMNELSRSSGNSVAVDILGTDVNEAYLESAARARFRPWSFRQRLLPYKDYHDEYFQCVSGEMHLLEGKIAEMVHFERINLKADAYPYEPVSKPKADIIICQNVLMYMAPATASRIVARLYSCLAPGGWLVVAPHEASLGGLNRFERVWLDGSVLFRKNGQGKDFLSAGREKEPALQGDGDERLSRGLGSISISNDSSQGAFPRPESHSGADNGGHGRDAEQRDHESPVLKAREAAARKNLPKALQFCDAALKKSPIDAKALFLRAMILVEMERVPEALEALRSTLFVDPQVYFAQFMLSRLWAEAGEEEMAVRSLWSLLNIISEHPPEKEVSMAEGLTIGSLREAAMAQLQSLSKGAASGD